MVVKTMPIYYVLMSQVGDGITDHGYWGRPEEMTMDRPAWQLSTTAPGSDLAAETAAAFSASYLVFRDTGKLFSTSISDI